MMKWFYGLFALATAFLFIVSAIGAYQGTLVADPWHTVFLSAVLCYYCIKEVVDSGE